MSTSTAPLQPPNLYTPMAYLPPELAALHELAAYVYVASLGVLAWDWLVSMPDEYRILSTGRISKSKIAYVGARLSTFGYCLFIVMFQVAPVGDCQTMLYIVVIFMILSSSTTNLLLLIRVRAVYGKSRSVTAFFGFWYLAILGTTLAIPWAMEAAHLGPTKLCIVVKVETWVSSATVCNAINCTLVFLAISYRISLRSIGETGGRSAAWRFLCSDGAPRVVRELLHQGQLCYLATIMIYIPQIFLTFTKMPGYQGLLIVTVQVIENIMNSRVHRAVILGLITNGGHNVAPCEFTTIVSTTTASSDNRVLKELATKHELV
ncbi:hypothetical protein FIBSPDRAFT_1041705 [Athelia psychrophila]|uniref:DUF6533 domain-containing protein n=1 Tax=Athelia psychrophila TaxID=1759441 RepID=A0A166NPL1_9AGAM|nr:hypothetical protein FIBSPDRAFT_1041705 [Fibularhizoctonia sp. CBS 109695]